MGAPFWLAVSTGELMGFLRCIGQVLLWVLAAACCARLAAEQGSATAVPWDLEAGTTAVLVEDHRAPLVSLRIELPAGDWSPWFVKHHAREALEIQQHDPQGRLRTRADELAAKILPVIGDRASSLHVTCLKQDLGPVLQLVRDIFENRDFDRSELRRWKHARRLEWEFAQMQPGWRSAQQAAWILFAEGDPRRWMWEGPREIETDAARLAQARDTLLRLTGRVIAFAGDMTREEVQRSAAGLLPAVTETAPESIEPQLLPVKTERPAQATVRLPRLTQVYFRGVRESLRTVDPEYPAFLVADHVLGGHFYSRLYVHLRHEGGETYGAQTVSTGDVEQGTYSLTTFTHAANAARTEQKLRELLSQFHEQGITEEERRAAIGYLLGRRAFERQSPGQILERYLEERRLGLRPGFLDELAEQASALSLEEINRFISDYFEPSSFTLIRVEPQP